MSTESRHEATRVATALIDAFNVADWDAFRATLAPDVVYEESGTQRRLEGVEAYVQACHGWRDAFSPLHGTIRTALGDDATAVLEIEWRGIHSGTIGSSIRALAREAARPLSA